MENEEPKKVLLVRRIVTAFIFIVILFSSLNFFEKRISFIKIENLMANSFKMIERHNSLIQIEMNLRSLINIANEKEIGVYPVNFTFTNRFEYLNNQSKYFIDKCINISNDLRLELEDLEDNFI